MGQTGEKKYFGWIPLLNDRLSFEKAYTQLEQCSYCVDSETDPNFFISHVKNEGASLSTEFIKAIKSKKEQIRDQLGLDAREAVFCFGKQFDDETDSDKYELVTLAFREDFRIKKIGIFSPASVKGYAIGSVLELKKNGLVSFLLKKDPQLKGETKERDLGNQIFAIIRDVYHEHIYANSTDLLLFPVISTKADDACEKVYDQYRDKIISYHKFIKDEINRLRRDSAYNCWTSMDQKTINKLIASAKGEMVYGKSFVSLCGLSKEKRQALESAEHSFQVLAHETKNLYASVREQRTYGLHFGVYILTLWITTFSLVEIFFQILPLSRKIPFTVLLFVLVFIVGRLFLNSRKYK